MTAADKIADAALLELVTAAGVFTVRERALADALLTLIAEMQDASELLAVLSGLDAAMAELLAPISGLMRDACEKAVGTHAAAVGDALGSTVN